MKNIIFQTVLAVSISKYSFIFQCLPYFVCTTCDIDSQIYLKQIKHCKLTLKNKVKNSNSIKYDQIFCYNFKKNYYYFFRYRCRVINLFYLKQNVKPLTCSKVILLNILKNGVSRYLSFKCLRLRYLRSVRIYVCLRP